MTIMMSICYHNSMPSCKSNKEKYATRKDQDDRGDLLAVGYLALHIGMASPALARQPRSTRGKPDNDRVIRDSLKGTYIFTQDGFENRRILTTTLPDRWDSNGAGACGSTALCLCWSGKIRRPWSCHRDQYRGPGERCYCDVLLPLHSITTRRRERLRRI